MEVAGLRRPYRQNGIYAMNHIHNPDVVAVCLIALVIGYVLHRRAEKQRVALRADLRNKAAEADGLAESRNKFVALADRNAKDADTAHADVRRLTVERDQALSDTRVIAEKYATTLARVIELEASNSRTLPAIDAFAYDGNKVVRL